MGLEVLFKPNKEKILENLMSAINTAKCPKCDNYLQIIYVVWNIDDISLYAQFYCEECHQLWFMEISEYGFSFLK